MCLKLITNKSIHKYTFGTFQVRSEITKMSQASRSRTRVGYMKFLFILTEKYHSVWSVALCFSLPVQQPHRRVDWNFSGPGWEEEVRQHWSKMEENTCRGRGEKSITIHLSNFLSSSLTAVMQRLSYNFQSNLIQPNLMRRVTNASLSVWNIFMHCVRKLDKILKRLQREKKISLVKIQTDTIK